MQEMPNLPDAPCKCFTEADDRSCVCGDSERVLRFLSGYAHDTVLTNEQREWCLSQIAAVEGYRREDFATAPTDDLARGVLEAWTDYARDKGLL